MSVGKRCQDGDNWRHDWHVLLLGYMRIARRLARCRQNGLALLHALTLTRKEGPLDEIQQYSQSRTVPLIGPNCAYIPILRTEAEAAHAVPFLQGY